MKYANYLEQDRIENSPFEAHDRHHKFNPTHTNRLLRSRFLDLGIELNTPDMNKGRKIEFSLLNNAQNIDHIAGPKYLIASENPYICPLNIDKDYLTLFKQIFTWNSNLLSLPNVTKIFVPNNIFSEKFTPFSERKIFACLINANKAFNKEINGDLYAERIRVIRWYEKNAPDHFSLFGMGWSKPEPAFSFTSKIIRRTKRLGTQIFGYKPFPSYRGEIENKGQVYTTAKFSFCYENVADLPDYITEKIFDSFFSGCVPVYWGANTINEHIPKECFIDRREFKDTSELHRYLLSIDEDRYQTYQKNIWDFLNSQAAKKFDTNTFADIITKKIYSDLT